MILCLSAQKCSSVQWSGKYIEAVCTLAGLNEEEGVWRRRSGGGVGEGGPSKYTVSVLTPIVALQTVSMGRVIKQVMVSATVRWNTR